MKFKIIKEVKVDFPGARMTYVPGQIIYLGSLDKFDNIGIHICFSYGNYTTIPIQYIEEVK